MYIFTEYICTHIFNKDRDWFSVRGFIYKMSQNATETSAARRLRSIYSTTLLYER